MVSGSSPRGRYQQQCALRIGQPSIPLAANPPIEGVTVSVAVTGLFF
jgi:hypothetical protein